MIGIYVISGGIKANDIIVIKDVSSLAEGQDIVISQTRLKIMIDYSIKNPLVVNLFLFLIVVIGVLSWQSMPEEMFPVVEKDAIKIITKYDGASPEEVEKQVTIPIEDTLDNLQDIDFYYSKSSEGCFSYQSKAKARCRCR